MTFTPSSAIDAPLPAPDPAYATERKRIVDDGAIWPVQRENMQSPRASIERLAEDMLRLSPDVDSPPVTGPMLQEEGWTLRQLQIFAAPACGLMMRRAAANASAADEVLA